MVSANHTNGTIAISRYGKIRTLQSSFLLSFPVLRLLKGRQFQIQ